MDAVDVLIVGAGPTGLTLACDLARQGISFRIVAESAGPAAGSRGFTLKPQSLAAFDDLGLAGPLTAEAWIERRLRFHLGPRRLFDLDLAPASATTERPYANSVALPQWRTEALLRERLAALGGKVDFGVALDGFSSGVSGVVATLSPAEQVRARYLVGADGGRSTVRRELGVEFSGRTSEDTRAVVADVSLAGLDPAAGVHTWLIADGGLVAARPIRGTGLWQVVAPGTDPDALRPALATATGRADLRITDVAWASVWRYNLRMASRYRVGPVFLAGDAAHVHSPFGGHGMNTGIQDAYNLGWKLGLVLRGLAGDDLLDTYETERQPVARAVLADSDERMKSMLVPAVVRPLLGFAMKRILAHNQRRTRNDQPAYAPGPLVGPGGGHPALDGRTPTGVRLFDLFRGSHFTVLGPSPLPGLDPALVQVHPLPSTGTFTVVRPDGYVALAAPAASAVRDFFDRFGHR